MKGLKVVLVAVLLVPMMFGLTACGSSAPGKVSNFLVAVSDEQIILSWAPPKAKGSSGITHYEISTDGCETWQEAETNSMHIIKDIVDVEDCDFKIRAVSSIGKGRITDPSQIFGIAPDDFYDNSFDSHIWTWTWKNTDMDLFHEIIGIIDNVFEGTDMKFTSPGGQGFGFWSPSEYDQDRQTILYISYSNGDFDGHSMCINVKYLDPSYKMYERHYYWQNVKGEASGVYAKIDYDNIEKNFFGTSKDSSAIFNYHLNTNLSWYLVFKGENVVDQIGEILLADGWEFSTHSEFLDIVGGNTYTSVQMGTRGSIITFEIKMFICWIKFVDSNGKGCHVSYILNV